MGGFYDNRAGFKDGSRPGALMTRQRIYSVSELTDELNNILEENYSIVWINGEISKLYDSRLGRPFLERPSEEELRLCHELAESQCLDLILGEQD